MPVRPSTSVRLLIWLLFCSGLVCFGGCKSPVKVYRVAGTVSFPDGKPLQAGAVQFIPDESKGNKSTITSSGMLNSNGEYSLSTEKQKGAPPGWYKVIISPNTPPMGGEMMSGGGLAPPATGNSSVINAKYTDATKTDLSVEVVANPAPGAYDLKVTK